MLELNLLCKASNASNISSSVEITKLAKTITSVTIRYARQQQKSIEHFTGKMRLEMFGNAKMHSMTGLLCIMQLDFRGATKEKGQIEKGRGGK